MVCVGFLSVNKFLNLKKRDRLSRLTRLPALLTVIISRYAIPLRYAIKAALGIRIFPFFPCPARTKGISLLAISCLIVNSFSPRISCVHSFIVSISTGCSAELSTGISSSSSSLLKSEVTFARISCFWLASFCPICTVVDMINKNDQRRNHLSLVVFSVSNLLDLWEFVDEKNTTRRIRIAM